MSTKLFAVIAASAWVSLKQAFGWIVFAVTVILTVGWLFYQVGKGLRYGLELTKEKGNETTTVDLESADCVGDTVGSTEPADSGTTADCGTDATDSEHNRTVYGFERVVQLQPAVGVTTVRRKGSKKGGGKVTEESVAAVRNALRGLEQK